MNVSPEVHILNPNPQCDSVSKGILWEVTMSIWGHERGAPTMGLVPLKKRGRGPGAAFLCHLGTQPEGCYFWARKKAIIRNWICWHLDLGLSASITVRKKCLLFKPPRLWHILLQPKLRQMSNVRLTFLCFHSLQDLALSGSHCQIYLLNYPAVLLVWGRKFSLI